MDRIGISPGAYLKELTQEDNPRTGLRAMATFEGSQSECMAKKLELQAMGLSDLFVGPMGNGFWQVRAHFPYGFDGVVSDLTVLPSIHEMDAVVQQTSIYRSTKLRTLLGGGSTAATKIGKLMRIIEDFKSGQYAVGVTDHGVAKAEVDAAAVDATYGVPLLRSVAYLGVEECIEYYAVYKRTLTAATPTQVTASFEGVGQIWTADEVTAYEGLDPDGWFGLEYGTQWLKSRPQVIAAAGQKTQVIYSYTECQIALSLTYDPYDSAVLLTP